MGLNTYTLPYGRHQFQWPSCLPRDVILNKLYGELRSAKTLSSKEDRGQLIDLVAVQCPSPLPLCRRPDAAVVLVSLQRALSSILVERIYTETRDQDLLFRFGLKLFRRLRIGQRTKECLTVYLRHSVTVYF